MGFWGVLWEIVKAVGPHAAPHVVRVVQDRKTSDEAGKRAQVAAAAMARQFTTLEDRITAAEADAAAAQQHAAAAEQKAEDAGERLALVQAQRATENANTLTWIIALLAWNAALTIALVYLLVRSKQ